MSLFTRRWRGDAQPTEPAGVLLASDGTRGFSARAVAKATALAESQPVAVVTIARIHGSSLGLPHPGLLPTKAEMKERLRWVGDAVSRLEHKGIEADGQVASTRKPARLIIRVARTRGVRTVVMDGSAAGGWRKAVEGNVAAEVKRGLEKSGVTVQVIPASNGARRKR